MDPNEDLMCGNDGEVLEDTFGEEADQLRPFPDGEYAIRCKKFNNSVLDLSQIVDGGIVHSYDYNSGDSQTWLFNYDCNEEGYIIKNKQNTNIFLSWQETASKENILRGFTTNHRRNHYWRIDQCDDGCFKLRNLDNLNMIITVQEAFSSFGGKQVIIDKEMFSDNENNQKWIINPVYFKTVQDGDYNIFNFNMSHVVVGLSKQEESLVYAQSYSVNENQEWKFSYDTDKEAYKIKSVLSTDLLLCCYGDAESDEMLLQVHKDEGNRNQYWRIERTQDGSYRIRNLEHLRSILILNATSSESLNGGLKLHVFKNSEDDANAYSKWIIRPICYQSSPDGDYHIFNNDLPDTVIDFSNQEDSLVYGNSYRAQESQIWKFVYNKEKRAYKINNALKTDLLLCWDTNDTSAEKFLRVCSESNRKNEYWRIEKIYSNGSCRLRNLEDTEKVISVIDKENTYGGKEVLVIDTKEGRDDKTTSNTWILQFISKPMIPDGKFKITTKSNYSTVITSNDESNLIITNNPNDTCDWKIQYDSTKRAYKIYSSKSEHLGWVYQDNNVVVLSNTDGPEADLRKYWIIEYRIQAGGFLIRSLCEPSQAVTSDDNNVITNTASYSDNQLFNLMRH